MFGEGLGEEMFLKYLKSLYLNRNGGVRIKICRGKGGSPYNVIIDADKRPGAFDKKIVILDNDKTRTEMAKGRQEAKTRGIKLIENTPCLESLLIAILDKKPIGKNSNWCKSEFESKYFNKKKRGESSEYIKLFPKELLDIKRSKISELNRLILIIEGEY